MRLLIFIILIIGAALLQGAGWTLFAVSPNFFLAVLFIAALTLSDFLSFGIVALVGLIAIRFQPGLSWAPLLAVGLTLVLYWIKSYLPWLEIFTVVAGLFAVTFLFYLIFDPRFVFQHPTIIFLEALYNIVIGGGLFMLMPRVSAKK